MKKLLIIIILLITCCTIGCQKSDAIEKYGTIILEEGRKYNLMEFIAEGGGGGFVTAINYSFDGVADSWAIKETDIIEFDGEYITALSQGEAVLEMYDTSFYARDCNRDSCDEFGKREVHFIIDVKVKSFEEKIITKLNADINHIMFDELNARYDSSYWFEITADKTAVYCIRIFNHDDMYNIDASWELYRESYNQNPNGLPISNGSACLYFYLTDGETVYAKADVSHYSKKRLYSCSVSLECE